VQIQVPLPVHAVLAGQPEGCGVEFGGGFLQGTAPEGDVGKSVDGLLMLPAVEAVGVGEDEPGPVNTGVPERAGASDLTFADVQGDGLPLDADPAAEVLKGRRNRKLAIGRDAADSNDRDAVHQELFTASSGGPVDSFPMGYALR
jgi:hypothetical protein